MNVHVDTLEYANMLVQAGMERAQAEAVAKLQARSVKDLIDHELVTKDDLKTALKNGLGSLELKLRDEIRSEAAKLRDEMRDMRSDLDRKLDGQMMQLRALQLGGAIAAFAISAIVLLSRLIR